MALKNAYRLLECEGYEVGKTFGEDNEIMNLLKIRNYSILAHGLDSVTEDDYLRFYERVLGYARIIDDKIDSKIEDATFPEL